MGNGHVRFGHGVAHQLRDLGERSIGQLMPVGADTTCSELGAGIADAVFAVPVARQSPPPPPRLGIALEEHTQGVRISSVTPGSLAEQAGLLREDVITEVAGRPVKRPQHLITAVRAQPAGTWLPLKLQRRGELIELVVRFPVEP